MAGKRQHYIPRFLQRGFLTGDLKKQNTYMYLNGGGVRSSNINNVGVEGFFYSIDGDAELDDMYTNLENDYASIINKIRVHSFNELNSSDLAKIIGHFEVRTNNLRKSFLSSSTLFLDKMADAFLDINVLNSLILNELKKKFLKGGIIDNVFNNLEIHGQDRDALFERILPMIEVNIEHYLKFSIEPIKNSFKLAVNERLKDVIKKGHIDGMLKPVSENKKLKIYESLDYGIINTDFSLILSDSMVIFEFENIKDFKPFYDIKNTLKSVYLPISANILIYGTKDNSVPNLKVINEMSAKCSSDFFIASEISSDFSSLQHYIGKNCALLTDSEMKIILKDVIREQLSQ
ncbi:DUF4238 domain-containing protein [Pantoea sp. KXB25]|uniref:DUF4238 domain-containing protein n=1 Tax=unclassified Pantoea TaxID=2630326 RepID=UPI003AB7648B